MPQVGFEPTIPASERPQTYALDRAATGTGYKITVLIEILGRMVRYFLIVQRKKVKQWQKNLNVNLILRLSCHTDCIVNALKVIRWATAFESELFVRLPCRYYYSMLNSRIKICVIWNIFVFTLHQASMWRVTLVYPISRFHKTAIVLSHCRKFKYSDTSAKEDNSFRNHIR